MNNKISVFLKLHISYLTCHIVAITPTETISAVAIVDKRALSGSTQRDKEIFY